MSIAGLDALMGPAKTDRWFTPPDLMARVTGFLGDDVFDPCPACVAGEPLVNGLLLPWRGRVYVNPPYGRAIVPWIGKATSDPVDELLLLCPARTDTAWFQALWELDLCFIRGRLRFSGARENAPFPCVLAYRGPRHAQFAAAFGAIGRVVRAVDGARKDGAA